MILRNFSQLNDINYSFDQMTALNATIDDISFSKNYFERMFLYGETSVIINPKLIIKLLNILIGTGLVEVQDPVVGTIDSIIGIYSIIQNMLGNKELLSFVYGNKEIISLMSGDKNLNLAIEGMRQYIDTFKGEFSRPE